MPANYQKDFEENLKDLDTSELFYRRELRSENSDEILKAKKYSEMERAENKVVASAISIFKELPSKKFFGVSDDNVNLKIQAAEALLDLSNNKHPYLRDNEFDPYPSKKIISNMSAILDSKNFPVVGNEEMRAKISDIKFVAAENLILASNLNDPKQLQTCVQALANHLNGPPKLDMKKEFGELLQDNKQLIAPLQSATKSPQAPEATVLPQIKTQTSKAAAEVSPAKQASVSLPSISRGGIQGASHHQSIQRSQGFTLGNVKKEAVKPEKEQTASQTVSQSRRLGR